MKLTQSFSIPANTTSRDLLNTFRIQNIPADLEAAQIDLYATGSATGLEHELFVGADNPVERSLVSAQNRVPLIPDDFVAQTFADGGEKLTLNVTNTTAGVLTYFLTLEVTPIA